MIMNREDFKVMVELIRNGNTINPRKLNNTFEGSLAWLEEETKWLNHLSPRFVDRVRAILLDEWQVASCKYCGEDSSVNSRTDRMKESIFTDYCSQWCSVHGSQSFLIASRTHYPNPKNSVYKS